MPISDPIVLEKPGGDKAALESLIRRSIVARAGGRMTLGYPRTCGAPSLLYASAPAAASRAGTTSEESARVRPQWSAR